MSDLGRSRLRGGDVVALGRLGLTARPARTVLTATGIAIGIAAVVAVLGISASSRAGLLAQLDALGTNILEVRPGQTLVGEASTLPAESPAMLARIGPVTDIAAVTVVDTTARRNELIPEAQTSGLTVVASTPGLLEPLAGQVGVGRALDAATVQLPAAVLGAVAAERLGIVELDGLPAVMVGSHRFAVVGLLDALPLAPNLDRSVIIGQPVATRLFGTDDNPSIVYLRTTDGALDDVRAVVPDTANPQSPNEVDVSRPSDALAARAAADVAFTALLLGLGAVALLVGGVGIANVMVISVLERTAEIGVRRALGATARHVRLQFLAESVMLAGAGGLAGIVLGAVVTVGYAASQGWLVDVPVTGLVAGVVVSLGVGAIAGLYPASRAAALDPAEAVRPLG